MRSTLKSIDDYIPECTTIDDMVVRYSNFFGPFMPTERDRAKAPAPFFYHYVS
ncbi:hypothetical protein QRB36_01965 [Mycobacterium marseillense]|uniref:hypothetical protein n=1 Tax=Mycobacterium marseillense TaxID=701042 RepID=UPI0025941956|nr:hypothetical protein [Mycobacterium marseillense]MDM3972933.1 hypothetical protein [Mycobacterium marseillense]